MKGKIIYLGFLFLVPFISCVGQEQNSKFDLFVKKNFRDITLPAKSDTLRPGDGSIPYEDIKQFLSDKSGAFYGKVDWEGYAPYKYFSPTWKFKRSQNVNCLIYAARRYGGQNILATYNRYGKIVIYF